MVKLKKLITKDTDQSWQLYIDWKTTMKGESDPRDSSGGSVTATDSLKFAKYVGRPTKKNNPGYIGWDREYIDDNSVVFIHYFETAEAASTYYNNLRAVPLSGTIPTKIKRPEKNYSIIWYLCDDSDNVIPFTNT
jgi:hypothetical protein